VEIKRVLNRRFASSVLHSCNVKTQICVTRPQCVKDCKSIVLHSFDTERSDFYFCYCFSNSSHTSCHVMVSVWPVNVMKPSLVLFFL